MQTLSIVVIVVMVLALFAPPVLARLRAALAPAGSTHSTLVKQPPAPVDIQGSFLISTKEYKTGAIVHVWPSKARPPDWRAFPSKYCTDMEIAASTPGAILGRAQPQDVNGDCVYSMKVPSGTPFDLYIKFGPSLWVESVEGGQATADVVTEKIGPDHIMHKHIAGVKYATLKIYEKWKPQLSLDEYAPQVPALVGQPISPH
jgi:hypothetical protein